MKTRILKYTAIFTVPLFGLISLTFTGWLTWALPIYIYAFVPFLELLMKPDPLNMDNAEEELVKEDRIYDYMLYLMVPTVYALLVYFFFSLQESGLVWWEIAGRVASMGTVCGGIGINVAHELGHRKKKSEQWMAKALLLSSMYMHFFIEHNRGHHKNVATEEDPASSRYGEMVYVFWFRSVILSWISAWKLESERLKRIGKSVFSIHNEMLRFQFIQLSLLAAIGFTFGTLAVLYFLGAAVIGFLLLETVNYIEHYGLQRKKNSEGIYERVLPVHSWNSDHVVGRVLLFELSRHSDHHFRATRKYQVLRHFEDSPQMPTGYPGMILLSLFPPAWFYVMHRQIDKYREQYGAALA